MRGSGWCSVRDECILLENYYLPGDLEAQIVSHGRRSVKKEERDGWPLARLLRPGGKRARDYASANATWSEIIGIHPPIGFLVVHRPPEILGGIRFHDAFPRATEE